MAKAIFSALLNFIKGIVDVFLAPINMLVVSAFPNFASLLSTFNSAVTRVLGTGLNYFSSILPPNTRGFIVLYLGILVSYYTITVSVHLIIKVIHIIKAVKIW